MLKTDVPKLGSFKFNFKTGSVKKRRPQTASTKKSPIFQLYRSEVRPRTAAKGATKKVRAMRF
jgi:hypothetical protein